MTIVESLPGEGHLLLLLLCCPFSYPESAGRGGLNIDERNVPAEMDERNCIGQYNDYFGGKTKPFMWRLQCGLFVLCISLCESIIAQNKQPAAISEAAYIIPFQLTAYNNLSVQAILNKKDTVYLMFHTA